jgi:hypothetical protein
MSDMANTFSMRDINNLLTNQFQEYTSLLNGVVGGGMVGDSQIRQIYKYNSDAYKEYDKGQIALMNGLDALRYMLDHREEVAKMIGLKDGSEIFEARRDFSKTSEFLSRMNSAYELGDVNHPMQMYVSKVNGNVSELDSLQNWQDYIMSQSWIDDLAKFSANGDASQTMSDYRISYLSDIV